MKKVYIHVHIPKTAGIFIKYMHFNSKNSKLFYPFSNIVTTDDIGRGLIFSNVVKCHNNILFLKKYLPSIVSSEVGLFSVVRNPYDRIYSLWKYCKIEGVVGSVNVPHVPEKFEDFIYELCNDEYLGYYFMQSQLFYLKSMEDFDIKIFKFEEMDKIKKFLVNDCNLIWGYKKINDTPGEDYRTVYTSKMVEMVKTKFKDEFKTFGYSTDLN